MPEHSTPAPRLVALPHKISRTTTLPTGDVIDIECESYPLPPDAPLVATPVSWVQLPPGTRRSQE